MIKMGFSDNSTTQTVTNLLCVFSVTLLQIFSLWWIIPATGEQREWLVFISLGLVLLPMIWVVSVIDENRFFPFKLSTLKIFIIVLGIFPLTWVLYKTLSLMVVIFSLGHWFALIYFLRRETRFKDMFSSLYLLFVVLVSWAFASRLIWWDGFGTFILRSPVTILVLVTSSLITFWALSDSPSPRPSKRFNLFVTILVITVVFGIISFRRDMFLDYGSINHWSVFVSPAEMVRQGGWLLWDVPSQYGFLSILAIAWFPAKTTWHALYYLDGIFIFLSSVILFFMLRTMRPGLLNAGFALFLTMAAIFFLPGWVPDLKGPQAFPSVGAYRFIWCFGLLGILAMTIIRQKDPKALFRYLVLGSGFWIVGSLWSFESALFCSVTWFPPFVIFLGHLIPSYFKGRSKRVQFGYFILGVTVPILFFGIVIIFISMVYLIQLGHLPDFLSFIEYSLLFSKDEFGSLLIDPYGAVWFLLLVFGTLGALCITLLRGGFPLSVSATALMGASCALWVTSSYFIGRSHENAVSNLVSVVCFVVVLAILAVKHSPTRSLGRSILRVVVVPIFAVIMVSVYGHGSFKNLVQSVYNEYSKPLDHYLYSRRTPFHDDLGLQDLLTLAEYKEGDPIVYIGPQSGVSNLPIGIKDSKKMDTQAQIWSPITPSDHIKPLMKANPDRISVYIDRFSERSRLSGWLLLRFLDDTREANTLVLEKLQVNYNLERKYQNGNWGLVWFQRKL